MSESPKTLNESFDSSELFETSMFALALWCAWSVFCSSASQEVSQSHEPESLELSITTGRSEPESSALSVMGESLESLRSRESSALSVMAEKFTFESPELFVSTKLAEPDSANMVTPKHHRLSALTKMALHDSLHKLTALPEKVNSELSALSKMDDTELFSLSKMDNYSMNSLPGPK